MEDKIEIGEWIRSKDGFIGKVQKINYDNMEKSNYYICEKDNVMASNYLENIAKHRKQLIDLIEVGDIVNKELVIGIIDITNDKEERVDRKLITQYRSAQFTGLDIRYYIYDDDIKTILTRESYMANCYKVGGEDE